MHFCSVTQHIAVSVRCITTSSLTSLEKAFICLRMGLILHLFIFHLPPYNVNFLTFTTDTLISITSMCTPFPFSLMFRFASTYETVDIYLYWENVAVARNNCIVHMNIQSLFFKLMNTEGVIKPKLQSSWRWTMTERMER